AIYLLVLTVSPIAPTRRTLSQFFFSSRRRHTRFSRDWSSDVCSSDLGSLRRLCHGFARSSTARFPRPPRGFVLPAWPGRGKTLAPGRAATTPASANRRNPAHLDLCRAPP